MAIDRTGLSLLSLSSRRTGQSSDNQVFLQQRHNRQTATDYLRAFFGMLQKPSLWSKQEDLHRSYSQGYGAQSIFEALDAHPGAKDESWKNRAAPNAWKDEALKLEQAFKKYATHTCSDLHKSCNDEDVLRLISISSCYDSIPSYRNLVDEEIVDPCGFWYSVGHSSDSNASECEEIPSRYSSGAESVQPKDIDPGLPELDCSNSRISCDGLDTDDLTLEQHCFDDEIEKGILLPWDV